MTSSGEQGSQRAALIKELVSTPTEWDMVVVGGGITGAGILHAAARAGLRVLLVEQRDFAWGSSSRSSKMVHGGLRYLATGQWRLARESVRERQRLLVEVPGLVTPLAFLMGHYRGVFPTPWVFNALLAVYDFFAGRRNHRQWFSRHLPFVSAGLRQQDLSAASQFADAVTDDARLVLRLLQEAAVVGGQRINYVRAERLLKQDGQVRGLHLQDAESGQSFTLRAKCVVNATGAWTDELTAQLGANSRVRPLRGSHLVVPAWRLPVAYAVSFMHPQDKRPVFAFPWEGVTVIGTTDLDHTEPLAQEASISQAELDYLLVGVNSQFPTAVLAAEDLLCTWSGVRPVVSHGSSDKPSDESREHALWNENGLISVAGGKLTTFRILAEAVLDAAQCYLPNRCKATSGPIFRASQGVQPDALNARQWQRLLGRYGPEANALLTTQFHPVAHTETLWAELHWALEHEMVLHLDDLLLRRTRLGLVLGAGVAALWPDIMAACQLHLGWDDKRWQRELSNYQALMKASYGLPHQADDLAKAELAHPIEAINEPA